MLSGRSAGFALVPLGPPLGMSEFCVVQQLPALWLGREAALQIFRVVICRRQVTPADAQRRTPHTRARPRPSTS